MAASRPCEKCGADCTDDPDAAVVWTLHVGAPKGERVIETYRCSSCHPRYPMHEFGGVRTQRGYWFCWRCGLEFIRRNGGLCRGRQED